MDQPKPNTELPAFRRWFAPWTWCSDWQPWKRRSLLIASALMVYPLSCGPVLATAFWLREATGWDAFYGAIWVYAPILWWAPRSIWDTYITWWCQAFHTIGPG